MKNSSESRKLSLDDIAALLVQLEPSDLPEVVRAWEALGEFARSCSAPVKELIDEAAEKLVEIIEDRAADPQGAVADAGRFLEDAMVELEDHANTARKRPPKRETEPKGPASSSEPASSEVEQPTALGLPADADLDLIADFITESGDLVEGAEAALLTLETNPDDRDAINTVFRAFHTVKGTSNFMGLTLISDFAHHAESLLSRIRDGEICCTGGYADLALRSIDLLKELIQVVQDALGGEPLVKPDGYDDLLHILTAPEEAGVSEDTDIGPEPVPRVGDILVAQGKAEREEIETVAIDQGERPIGEAIVKSETASVKDVAKALRTQKRMTNNETTLESSVRVRTDRLDRLIETVGELVIAQSMVTQDAAVNSAENHEVLRKVTHVSKIVRELQDLSMSMRMVPLKGTFQKMARIVRDLAHKSGKNVEFVTEGEDTEIDRNMVDSINDPLVHLVRNAVDHGIEEPKVRETGGKPKSGRVTLSARHSGGNVVVEIEDDGKGLDRARIVEKAISKGLIESEKAMSDNEVFSLIFEPGFSTTEKVTEVSGRGVGLDVVKKGVDALRGRVDVSSEPEKGCTFSVHVPLTLAVTDGMLVKVGAERYIVPTLNIDMSFRPAEEMISTVLGRGEMVLLRGELIPIFRLHRLFDIEGAVEEPTKGLLILTGDSDHRYALLVDELLGQQQVVAKSLGEGIGRIQGVFGGAILGDGCVGLILDPQGLFLLAKQTADAGEEEMTMWAPGIQ